MAEGKTRFVVVRYDATRAGAYLGAAADAPRCQLGW